MTIWERLEQFAAAEAAKLVKPEFDNELAVLKSEEAVNVQIIQNLVAQGSSAVDATVNTALSGLKANAVIGGLLALAVPTLEADLTAELQGLATSEVPTLYSKLITFLTKVDSSL